MSVLHISCLCRLGDGGGKEKSLFFPFSLQVSLCYVTIFVVYIRSKLGIHFGTAASSIDG